MQSLNTQPAAAAAAAGGDTWSADGLLLLTGVCRRLLCCCGTCDGSHCCRLLHCGQRLVRLLRTPHGSSSAGRGRGRRRTAARGTAAAAAACWRGSCRVTPLLLVLRQVCGPRRNRQLLLLLQQLLLQGHVARGGERRHGLAGRGDQRLHLRVHD
jgi:hypothetical protein